MERVNVGLVGFGTVGGAFYRLMQANGGLFESKFGVAAGITAVAEKDPGKVQAAFPGQKVVADYRDAHSTIRPSPSSWSWWAARGWPTR